jgi:hypothetical protein
MPIVVNRKYKEQSTLMQYISLSFNGTFSILYSTLAFFLNFIFICSRSIKKSLMFLQRVASSGTHHDSQPLQYHHKFFVRIITVLIIVLVLFPAVTGQLSVIEGPNENTLTITVSYEGNYVLSVFDGIQESSYYAQEPQSLYYTLRREAIHTFEVFSILNDELLSLEKITYDNSNIQKNGSILEQIEDVSNIIIGEQIVVTSETLSIIDSKEVKRDHILEIRDRNTGETLKNVISNSDQKNTLDFRMQNMEYEEAILYENHPYDMVINFESGPVKGIELKDIMLKENLELGIDEVNISRIGIVGSNSVRAFAIDPEKLDFDYGIVTSIAQGKLLWKCANWNFNISECEGTWNPIMRITPGEEYSFLITPNDPGYLETGLSVVNTDLDNYFENESVHLIIAVLDNEGFLVSNSNINITIISPNNDTYKFGTYSNSVTETKPGIYISSFSNTNNFGVYEILIETESENYSTTFSSFFKVSETIPYRIIRQTPTAIDPWQGDFFSAYRIMSYEDEYFSFRERIPIEANITAGNYDIIEIYDNYYEAVWHNLTNNSVISLFVQAPLITPDLMILGPVTINSGLSNEYVEFRPWFIALDPTAYYDPTRNIAQGWNAGTGTTFAEIDDGTRQPSVPNTGDYVRSQANSGQVSTFGFNNITQPGITSIRLWVYTSTGSNAQYTFSLLQGTTSRCSNAVPVNTASQWRSCTWSTVSGDLSDLRLNLAAPTRNGGGALQFAFVYAGYLEITFDGPPNVTLNSPANNVQVNSLPALFNFTVIDDADSILPSCSLYGNFSGSWASNQTITNVNNGTWRNFSIASINDAPYLWNVLCTDSGSNSAFSSSNRTVNINVNPPNITNIAFNETTILQGKSIRLNASITDYYGISIAIATIRLPNGTERNSTMSNSGNEYFIVFSDTALEGTYNLTRIFANDTLGQIANSYPSITFDVIVQIPDSFDLISPPNNTVSSNLLPNLTWTQTNSHSFKNYTIQLDKDVNFGSPDYTYVVTSISQTWYPVDFALDTNSVYYWRVLAYDNFNNIRISNSTFIYITDTLNPSVTLNNPSNNGYSINSLTQFNYTPSDANGISSCTLYGNFSGSWQANTTSSSITNGTINSLSTSLSEGIYLWNVRCIDNAGNSAFATSNRTVIVDLSGPIITLTNPTNNSYINDTNTLTFNASSQDTYSSLNQCSLLINGTLDQTINGVSNGVGFSFNTFLLNGYYYWQVNCTDIHGFEGISDSFYVEIEVVDNDPPFITLDSPANNTFVPTTTITFLYTPQDSTGILSCSLYINNSLNQTDFSVVNLEQNSFTVPGLNEDYYSWFVSCIDSAPEENEANSSTFYFDVDITTPTVVLNSPNDGSITNISPIIFNATGYDVNLDYCQLYTNRSGSFAVELQNNTVLSGVPFTLSLALSNEVILWNVLCYDKAGNNAFATSNRTLTHDSVPPKYSFLSNSPTSPVAYNSNNIHVFNVTWTDEIDVNVVFFESNFTGAFINTSVNEFVSNVYSFNTSALSPGIYYYRWHANDTAGNFNTTGFLTYEVVKANSIIQLLLNSNSNNLTINEGQNVNITATLQTPNTGLLELLINGILFDSGNSPLTNISQYDNPGSYNITARYNETQNYSGTISTLFLTIQDITDPIVNLISPSDNGLVAAGTIIFQFNVSDKSALESCSLYIDSSLDQIRTDVITANLESFTQSLGVGDYEWYVSCEDSWGNIGNSSTYNFSTIDTDEIVVSLVTELEEYERGEIALINVSTSDVFFNPLKTDISSDFIYANTSVPWWNTNWKQRRILQMNETTGTTLTAYVEMNITGLSGINSCQNHLRIIEHNPNLTEIPYLLISGNNNNWCFVGFEVNLSANEQANNKFFAYYNTTTPSNPSYSLNFNLWQNYFASAAAADEGTPTNVANIIGNNDATFARMTQGGGAGTHSAHGRGFIIGNPQGTVLGVEARYRYAVPSMCGGCTWALRYSVNDGTSYTAQFSGASTSAQTTSSWANITSAFTSMNWTEINRTRLQGRMVKTGGGGTGTLDLYWVEINVTYRKAPNTTQVSIGNEHIFISRTIDETNNDGTKELNFTTNNLQLGTYSIVSVASADSFTDSSGFVTFDVVPDVTPPDVVLISPDDFAEFGVGRLNLTYNITDLNPDSCTLYFGSGAVSWSANETMSTSSNGQYTFQNIYFGLGIWEWNVLCLDAEGNTGFAIQNYTLNITGPDLTFGIPGVWLSNEEKIEGVELTIFANITNVGLSNSEEPFNVSFYRGDPDLGGLQIGTNETILSLQIGDTEVVSSSFVLEAGVNNIFVYIDRADVINESNEANNKQNITVSVEIYHYYHGNITAEILLSNANNQTVIDYSNFTDVFGHIIATSSDAVFSFSDLVAIGRNTLGNPVSGDFSDIDNILNTTAAPDSINNVWTNGTDSPLQTTTYNIGTNTINNVPIIYSTNSPSFITGILWDSADDTGNLQFDTTNQEDLIFISKINMSQTGAYGTYDYEIRVPAKLRGNDNKISFYVELE